MFSDSDKARLLEAMRRTGTMRLEIECGDDVLTLGLSPNTPAQTATPVEIVPPAIIKSPALGRFVACGAGDGLRAASVGDRVRVGQVLGYVGLDGAHVPVFAPKDGVLVASHVQQEDRIIGYGDALFELEAGS